MTKTKQVFISHATKDAQFAHRLADDLKRLGMQVWIAPESIRPGEGWVDAIERGLKESSHVVVVLTPAALESKWVRKETNVTIAQERKGRIQVIPLDVKPCEVPLLLSSYQMVSFRRDYDAGLSQLAAILGVRVTPPKPVRPPRRAPARVTIPRVTRPVIPAGEFFVHKITDECIACGACEPECPTEAISEGYEIYIIDPDLCTGCVGSFDEAQCAWVCPVDCCVPDPEHEESKEELQAKYDRLHG